MTPARTIFRTASAFAFLALIAGSVHAALEVWPRTWVLEFQAGPPSGTLEKLAAVVHSAAIEGFGFMALGAVLGLAALGVVRLLPHMRVADSGSGYVGALILCAGAFFGWAALAWLADDALAFLTRLQVIALDLVACTVFLAALVFFDFLVRRCPWAPHSNEALALGSVAAAGLATRVSLNILKSGDQGWGDPSLLALAGVTFLLAIPVGGGIARAVEWPVVRVRGLLQRERWPLAGGVAAWLVLLGCGAWTALHWELSSRTDAPEYATLAPRPEGVGPNVVFVTIDTLRADHLGCYGYPRPTSPTIDVIAREGTLCAQATSAASWTKPATGTILTGLHPSRHGALYHGSLLNLPDGKSTLAEAFRRRGYVTAGFVANPNLKKVFGFDNGFDVFFDSPVEDTLTLACIRGTWFGGLLMELLRHDFNWKYENDVKQMNVEVLAWLRKNSQQRFFLYAHYIDPHIPYDPPARYREEFTQSHGMALFNERKRKVGIDLYDGEIRYSDDGLKELVDELKSLGVWENTIFVLTSDHGEEFFEHGVIGHGFSLYQEVVHVPLILRGPGVPVGKVYAPPVQILDLAASVLQLAGREEEEFGDGRSFIPQLLEDKKPAALQYMESEFGQDDSNHRAFVFSGVRAGKWKLVLTEQNQFFPPNDRRYGREALYDLEADPDEHKNLFREEEHQALVQRLLESLLKHSGFLQAEGFRDIPPAALDPEVEASLRALGYIGDDE